MNVYRGHSDAVMSVQWSPHSKSHFASSGSDSTVVLWEIGGNHAAQPPRKHPLISFQLPSAVTTGAGDGDDGVIAAATSAPSTVTGDGDSAVMDVVVGMGTGGGVEGGMATPGKRGAKRRRKGDEGGEDGVATSLTALAAEDTEPKEIVFRHAGHR